MGHYYCEMCCSECKNIPCRCKLTDEMKKKNEEHKAMINNAIYAFLERQREIFKDK